jgi:adenylate kinase family enzyme
VQRIAVVGSGGAGKTTFARELGARLGLPVVHLDEHFWQPGWVETSRDEWRLVQKRLIAGDAWVVDGNYGGTLDIRFRAADTIVMLDYPRLVCMGRALRRGLVYRGRAIQAKGCPERLDRSFLRWVWNYRRDSRPRLLKALEEHGSSARFVRITSPRRARRFLAEVSPGG